MKKHLIKKGVWRWAGNWKAETDPRFSFKRKSEDNVLLRVPFPDRVVIRKGHFPDTAQGIDDRFCFVSLDMDLYLPQLAGLRFFYDRMEPGGVILMQDYFCDALIGSVKAVEDYEQERGMKLAKAPIGDRSSLLIIKY